MKMKRIAGLSGIDKLIEDFNEETRGIIVTRWQVVEEEVIDLIDGPVIIPVIIYTYQEIETM